MIFFMVKCNLCISSYKTNVSSNGTNTTSDDKDNDNSIEIDNDSNRKKDNTPKYTKIIIENPYNNRDFVLKVSKKQKGVYVWETLDGKSKYVGHSINLYNRVSSYFMPSILNTKARKVLKYLNKYGFNNIRLILYIMSENSTLNEVVQLEQHFIDTVTPNLNVDLVASGSGYHGPMSEESRMKLPNERGTPVFLYEAKTLNLLHIFNSKNYMYDSLNIHHKTLHDCLDSGSLYLDYFFLSLDQIEDSNENILELNEVKSIVNKKRELHRLKHPAAKSIIAINIDTENERLEFVSLNNLAKHLKGDRKVIRDYLKGNKSGYYRGK